MRRRSKHPTRPGSLLTRIADWEAMPASQIRPKVKSIGKLTFTKPGSQNRAKGAGKYHDKS